MNDEITCRGCPYLEIRRTEKAMRGFCHCSHESAAALSKVLTVENENAFIAFTPKTDPNTPKVKTSPRWCPLKLAQDPLPIHKNEAYAIISDRKCRGLFYTFEESGVTAIDALPDYPVVEDFTSVPVCVAYLRTKGEQYAK